MSEQHRSLDPGLAETVGQTGELGSRECLTDGEAPGSSPAVA
ncbi:hypothetical protein [Streptomyces sp. NPDC055400]